MNLEVFVVVLATKALFAFGFNGNGPYNDDVEGGQGIVSFRNECLASEPMLNGLAYISR